MEHESVSRTAIGSAVCKVVSVLLIAIAAASSAAATYDLSWNAVAGGGTTFSSVGNYTMGSTAGQAAATPISSGSKVLQAGFWAVRAAPLAPVLQSKASRKVHGGAGTFNLPLTP